MRKISILAASLLFAVSLNAQGLGNQHANIVMLDDNASSEVKPRYQGVVIEVLDAKAYTYLKIDEKTPGFDPKKLKSFWIVVDSTSAKVGDYVRFKKNLVTKMYKSKILNKNFDELMFATDLEYRVSK
ncbi:MAG: hypothetical protein ACJAWW_001849 [Sulfurimonas sp.]|jgi:hypothetical protein